METTRETGRATKIYEGMHQGMMQADGHKGDLQGSDGHGGRVNDGHSEQ